MLQTSQTTPASAEAPSAQPASSPALSVILPNYNHGRLIARAVTALLAQERVPDEIIVIDDGSTDDSLRVIEQLAAGSDIIRVIASPTNEGVPAALSRGLAVARGKYLYLAAADDWVLPGFFSTALPILESHPTAAFVCGESYLISGRTGEHLGVRPIVRPSNRMRYFTPDAVATLLKHADNWILTGSTIFVRERAVAAGGLPSELGSFADGFLGRKLALTHGFCYVPRLMATWQVFNDSISRETASDAHAAERILGNALARFAGDPVFPRWYGTLFSRRFHFGIARLALEAQPVNEAALLRTTSRSGIDRACLSAMIRLSAWRPVRALVLFWLWLRFRPMNPILVLRSALWRYFARASS
jgi:glycosyltransferase involved in cell wall biosynthesis